MAETISFARGAPSPDLLPVEAIREATARALEDDWKTALSYGVGIGHPGLCERIASIHGIPAGGVMVTNGSLEAGAMVFRHLVSPGDRVAVEQPSYDRTLLLLEQLGAEFVPIPLEADGMDVDAVERALEAGPLRLVHAIPNFHNPAGSTLSEEKRRRLVALAAEHDFMIFEDDPYREISFGDPPPPTMLSMDEAGRVVHSSSYSKTVSPGIRVGFLAGPEETIASLARTANENYISPNMLAGSLVLQLYESGAYEQNLEVVNGKLAERRVFPAIDVSQSGTRREELLLDPATLHAVTMLRRTLSSMNPVDAMEQLTKQLGKYKTNAEFIKLISAARD